MRERERSEIIVALAAAFNPHESHLDEGAIGPQARDWIVIAPTPSIGKTCDIECSVLKNYTSSTWTGIPESRSMFVFHPVLTWKSNGFNCSVQARVL